MKVTDAKGENSLAIFPAKFQKSILIWYFPILLGFIMVVDFMPFIFFLQLASLQRLLRLKSNHDILIEAAFVF